MKSSDEHDTARRSFLLSTGGLLTTTWLGSQWAAITAVAHHAEDMAAAEIAAAPAFTGYQFLSAAEAADVDAISAQIVPSGTPAGGSRAGGSPPADAMPGAREARAVYFIDRSLATIFASWGAGFRSGLEDFQQKFRAAHPGAASFAAASSEDQIAFLTTVETTAFFQDARNLTLLGMFASPKYGGNHQGSGWTLMGFEDRHAFTPPFGYYDARYTGFVPYAKESA